MFNLSSIGREGHWRKEDPRDRNLEIASSSSSPQTAPWMPWSLKKGVTLNCIGKYLICLLYHKICCLSEFDTNHGNKETNWQAVDMSTQCLSRWDWYHEKDMKLYFISKNHRLLFWHWPSKCKEYKQLLLDLLRYFVFCLTLSQTPFKHQVRFQSSRIQNCSSFCTFVPFLRMIKNWTIRLWGPQT